MHTLRTVAVLAAVLALTAGLAAGQVLYGNLVGNVTDPNQAAIVKAVVAIDNRATGYSSKTTTDERGSYEILNIPPGTYDVKISAPGFAVFEAKEIGIVANNITRVDAPLRIGNITET